MPRAVIYVRVSTSDQVENYSLETQENECSNYCERQGLAIDRIFREEGESAKTVNRTELQEMLRYLSSNAKKREITHVVVYRVDRLAREVGGHHTIKATLSRLNVTLHSVLERFDETPTGKLTENLMAVLAQFDNDLRSQRTKDGMRAAVAHGRWVWRAPYGYRNGSKSEPSLVADPIEAPIVREIFSRAAAGESKDAVRRWAASQGLVTATGKALSPSQMHRMLNNPLYVGQIRLSTLDVVHTGDFEPLIDPEVFRMATHSITQGGARAQPRVLHDPDFPLRRNVRCGPCDWPLTASWSTGRHGVRYAYYRCRNGECRATKVKKADMEAAFAEWLDRVSLPEVFFEAMLKIVPDVVRTAQASRDAERARVRTALDELEARETKLMDSYLDGVGINEATFTRHLRSIAEARVSLQEAMATLQLGDFDLEATLAKAQRIFSDLRSSWNRLDPMARQQFLRILIPDGIHYENGVVGTAERLDAIRGILAYEEEKLQLAVPAGPLWNQVEH